MYNIDIWEANLGGKLQVTAASDYSNMILKVLKYKLYEQFKVIN